MEKEAFNSLVKSIRCDFVKGSLMENEVDADPLKQFSVWLDQAFRNGNSLANAMTLSTVDTEGMPSSRVMLLRDVSSGGFTFFTNYHSKKGKDLTKNNKASILFFWPELERQVRVQGLVSLLPEKESEDYFRSRPFESQVGAWVSQQSEVVEDRAEMDRVYERLSLMYKDRQVPKPPHWGGLVLVPLVIEFWQGRAGRLHDRLQYRSDGGVWVMERLMP